jgi:hypothetical protein
MIQFVTTCATLPVNTDPTIIAVRDTEYTIALHKLENYKLPIHAILSETNDDAYSKSLFKNFTFTSKTLINSTTELGAKTKSQKEFVSIQKALHNLDSLHDDDWIIKTTGRYVFISDTFYTIVKHAESKARAIVKLSSPPSQAYTFCFAMRVKEFREFYSQSLSELGNKNVERFLLEFLKKNEILTSTVSVSNLGILANIANSGNYQIV